jgi:serine/threonine-protein phosphatase 5
VDAGSALAADPGFIKAYYRRGSAQMALGKLKQARADFRRVAQLRPQDKDARAKLDECEKVIKKRAFEEVRAQWEGAGELGWSVAVGVGCGVW